MRDMDEEGVGCLYTRNPREGDKVDNEDRYCLTFPSWLSNMARTDH